MAGRQRDRAGGRLAGGAHRRLRAAVRTRLPQTGKVSLTRSEVRFEPGDPARDGRVVVAGTQGEAASRCTVGEAIPGLLRAYRAGDASDSAAWWGAATALALDLVGRGQIVPRLSANEVDEWRVGPLAADDHARIDALVRAMPSVPDAATRLRAYLDACADVLPRRGEGPDAPCASLPAEPRPELREWGDGPAGERRAVRAGGRGRRGPVPPRARAARA